MTGLLLDPMSHEPGWAPGMADWGPSYIGVDGAPAPRETAILTLPYSFEEYRRLQKKQDGGNRRRDWRKGCERGWIVSDFVRANWLPDLVEINHSKAIRCGGPMRPAYLKTLEELGGAPRKQAVSAPECCPVHWARMYGVFEQVPQGRRQGVLHVCHRLIAYATVRRIGDLIMYSQWLGHGDFLQQGVMYMLHFEIVARAIEHWTGVRHLMYGGWHDGGPSLTFWKKKLLFESRMLQVNLT